MLQDLYRSWADRAVTVDLADVWRRLDAGPWKAILEHEKAAGPRGPAAR